MGNSQPLGSPEPTEASILGSTDLHAIEGYSVPNYINALLNQNLARYWNNGVVGKGETVTYNFPDWSWSDDPQQVKSIAYFSPTQAEYAEEALRTWSAVANITFGSPEAPGDDSMIQFRLYDDPKPEVGGGAYYPYQVLTPDDHQLGGNVYIDVDNPPDAVGTYGFQTLIHEIGHALGLKHPGDYNAGNDALDEPPYLPAEEDAWIYTVMSYHSTPGGGVNAPYVVTPMLYDVAAIQFVYGPNLDNHSDDDSYVLDPAFMSTIWDTGGVDTVSVTAAVTSAIIDLRPGHITYLNDAARHAIAFNPSGVAASTTAIENAVGSSGNDLLMGNDADNVLIGGLGVGLDILAGGKGRDIMYGGPGADILKGGKEGDIYIIDEVADSVVEEAAQGIDTILTILTDYTLPINVENLVLAVTGSNCTGVGNSLNNIIIGSDACGDLLRGLGGADVINGRGGAPDIVDYSWDQDYGGVYGVYVDLSLQQGIDGFGATDILLNLANVFGTAFVDVIYGDDLHNVLKGGNGNDTLVGGGGWDTLDGEAGADTMMGGADDDGYFVDDVGDVATENANEGVDTIMTSLTTYTLPNFVENLLLAGPGNCTGIGNDLMNTIGSGFGNDTLIGGLGDDTLIAQGGNDLLTGGDGTDSFAFSEVLGAGNVDTIFDFGNLEHLLLRQAVFSSVGPLGTLAAAAFVDLDGGTETASSRILYNSSSGVLSYDPDGTGAAGATQFATLANHAALTHENFTIVDDNFFVL
jgi:serralysin